MPLLRPTVVMTAMMDEPGFWRKLSLSLPAMGVLTGVVFRTYRAVVYTFGWSDSWLWIAGTFVIGAMMLFLLATLHLGNYPPRAWWWRAPLFALVEALTEVLVSLLLTVLGLEVVGSMQATLEDWPLTATRTLFLRVVGISMFAAVLAVVSTIVRVLLLKGHHKPTHA